MADEMVRLLLHLLGQRALSCLSHSNSWPLKLAALLHTNPSIRLDAVTKLRRAVEVHERALHKTPPALSTWLEHSPLKLPVMRAGV